MPPLGNSLSRQVAFLAYEASSSVTVSTSPTFFEFRATNLRVATGILV
jgi:hypothetical protein